MTAKRIDLRNGYTIAVGDVDPNLPAGKGMMVWKIKNVENGNPAAGAQRAVAAGIKHVAVKILDGPWAYNQRPVTSSNGNLTYVDDILLPWVEAFQAAGIKVLGWQYVYFEYPEKEGDAAVARVKALGLDGFAIDAESEAKVRAQRTARYVSHLNGITVPVALCSYRYPKLHTELAWNVFLNACQFLMPQVYWEQSTNAGAQLEACLTQYQDFLGCTLPVIPVGSAYARGSWACTPSQLIEFMNVAKRSGCQGFELWDWNNIMTYLPELWTVLTDYNWSNGETPVEPEPSDAEKLRRLWAAAKRAGWDLGGA